MSGSDDDADHLLDRRWSRSRRRFVLATGLVGAAAVSAGVLAVLPDEDTIESEPIPVPLEGRHDGRHDIAEFATATVGDPAAMLQRAIDYYGGLTAAGRREDVVLTVSTDVVLTDTIVVDSRFISLEFLAGSVDASALGDRAAFRFDASAEQDSESDPRTADRANNRKSVRGLWLVGGDEGVGLQFSSSESSVRGVGFYDLEIRNFRIGISIENRAFLLSFQNFHVYGCDVGVEMPAGFANYGENIRFLGGGIGSCALAVRNRHPDGNFHFFSTSFDFNGQAVVAERGGVFLHQPHIETNRENQVRALAEPQFVTGSGPEAKITITGGTLLFHRPPQISNIFYTRNTSWGGGIVVAQLALFRSQPLSGYLCGGTGLFRARDSVLHSGQAGVEAGSILTAKALNQLVDGNFAGGADGRRVLDAFLDPIDGDREATVTNRTSGTQVALSVEGGLLRLRRLGSEAARVSIDVACESGVRYASSFTISSITEASGVIVVRESFVAAHRFDARGIPITLRTYSSPGNAIELGDDVLGREHQSSQTAWDRAAPPWASHFRLSFELGRMVGRSIEFSEIVVTGL